MQIEQLRERLRAAGAKPAHEQAVLKSSAHLALFLHGCSKSRETNVKICRLQ